MSEKKLSSQVLAVKKYLDDLSGKMDKEIVDVNFENWLRLLDSETDCI